jgi:PAS domain S-box-containing protein
MGDRNRTKRELLSKPSLTERETAEAEPQEVGRDPSNKTWPESRDAASTLLNMMGDAALLISTEGVLLCLNEHAARKLGDPVNELVGRNFFELLPPDLAAKERKRIVEAMRSGMPTRSVDADGGFWTETLVNPVAYPNGRVEMLALFFRDITDQMQADLELRKAKEAAESADVAKTRFLANISHELRTPLNAIIGFSEILEAETFGPLNERQSRYVRHVARSGHHLLELINDILDLAKVGSGKMELHLSEVSIPNVVERSVSMIAERAARQGITIHLDIDEEFRSHVFQADERKFRQIFLNLFSNAVKFTPDGGRIELKVCRKQEDLFVSVTDTGIGLKVENLERIFGPFEQVDSSYARSTHGTGLGLALSKSLVELHGGRMWVHSEGIGKGSTFAFAVPLIGFRRRERRELCQEPDENSVPPGQ